MKKCENQFVKSGMLTHDVVSFKHFKNMLSMIIFIEFCQSKKDINLSKHITESL